MSLMETETNKRDGVTLPVLPAESLLVSVGNPGEFLLSLLLLLLLFLGQGPLKVLDDSILLPLWAVTLTLLLTGEEGRTVRKQARPTVFVTHSAYVGWGTDATAAFLVLFFHFSPCQTADLGEDVILILQDKPSLSVVLVPVQLNDQRLLIQVQLTLF